jgi:hypothetical protein
MRRLSFLLAPVLIASALLTGSSNARADNATKTWHVTIANLTAAQPLSPPLFAVHTNKVDVWSVGSVVSPGVAAIAEDADNATLTAALTGAPGVRTVETGAGGPIAPGTSRTYAVETRGKHNRVSVLTMLVNTNDAFTGLDSLHVMGQGGALMLNAYDAGSERNNELAAFIPGPCCGHPFVRDPTSEPVAMHPGITGVGDLDPAVYDWSNPVARITITR